MVPLQHRVSDDVDRARRRGVFVEDLREHRQARVARKRPPARDHLVEDGAEAEDVRPRIDPPAFRLFGRHVRRRCQPRSPTSVNGEVAVARLTRPRPGRQLRQAEVEDLDPAVAGDDQVRRLQVAVHDPGFVCPWRARRRSARRSGAPARSPRPLAGMTRSSVRPRRTP